MNNNNSPEKGSAKLIKIVSGLSTAGILMMFIGAVTKKLALFIAGIAVMLSGGVVSSVFSAKRRKEFGKSTEEAIESGMGERTDMNDPIVQRILQNPYVLKDERIPQLVEVQNLMQYVEIQRVFFDPGTLNALSPHPRVRELLNIVRDWITQNNAEEIFAAAEKLRPANMPTVQQNKTAQSNLSKKSTAVFVILFIVVWLMVFISIVSTVMMSVWHHKI